MIHTIKFDISIDFNLYFLNLKGRTSTREKKGSQKEKEKKS